MSVVDRLRQRRAGRLVSFVGVGGVGMVVDLTITFALLGTLSPVAANAVGWSVAVTHNFAGNWYVTFDRPDGSLGRQYLAYVGFHALTFGLRAVVLSTLLATTTTPATVASVGGIAAAAVVNFLASERIFAGDLVDGLNRAVHRLWGTRLRSVLVAAGVYQLVFDAYARVLARLTNARETIRVGPVAASLATETPTETVSVLHTVENERSALEAFVADLRAGDHVLDVGANVGVYAALAAAAGASVTAVEPHAPTAARLRQNVPDAAVHELALGPAVGTVGLAIRHDARGTQRARVGGETTTVEQLPGDALPTPDVIKIDVEGAEAGVLDGLSRTLAAEPPRVIYVETHDHATRAAIAETLAAAGYDIQDAYAAGANETIVRATHHAP